MRAKLFLLLLLEMFFAQGQDVSKILPSLYDSSSIAGKYSSFHFFESVAKKDTIVSFGSLYHKDKHGLWINVSKTGFLNSYEMFYKGALLESCEIDSNGFFWNVQKLNTDSVLKIILSKEDSMQLLPYLYSEQFVGLYNGLHLYKKGNYIEIVEEYALKLPDTHLDKYGVFLVFNNGQLFLSTRLNNNVVNGILSEYDELGLKKEFTYLNGLLNGFGYIYCGNKVIASYNYWSGNLFCGTRVNKKIKKEGFLVNRIFVPFFDYSISESKDVSAFNGIYGLSGPGYYKPKRCKCK